MSFLLDPLALLVIGFISGKSYYLLTVFGDRLLKRGLLKKRLAIVGIVIVALFWVYSSLLYLNVIFFPWPLPRWFGGTDWMLNSGLPTGLTRTSGSDVVAVVIFATYPLWFYLGSELGLAGHRLTRGQRVEERNQIIAQLVATTFPVGGALPPGAAQVGTAELVESLFKKIPPMFADALTLLLFVFDSRFFVFAFTGKFKRFVDLGGRESSLEKRKYMQAWEANPFLMSAATVLRITSSYGYYTRPQVYKLLDYTGPMIPNLPPWYNPGPAGGSDTGSDTGGRGTP